MMRGEPQLHARLRALRKIVPETMRLLGPAMVAEQKRLVPRKTSNLGRSISVTSLTPRSTTSTASANYAAHVEYGTRPHVIRARKGRALRFPASGVSTRLSGAVRAGEARRLGKGAYVFRASVNHPGTRPQPYMVPGARRAAERAGLADLVVRVWNGAA